jgi:5'-AMP-activated protein kinase, catalytic alpha subunit
MEHVNAGELFDYIVRHERVDDAMAAKFFSQILDGVEYLHENGVCHRDLKPENLLLEKQSNNLKIIDFGLSNLYKFPHETLQTACGSPCYAAPEMIAGKEYHGLKVDTWSCGVILFAMLCGYLPFEDPNTDKLYKKILNCDYSIPNYISESGKDLIQKILNTDPEERYNLMQIRSHPWFVKNIEKSRKKEETPRTQRYQYSMTKNGIFDHNLKEIKINP